MNEIIGKRRRRNPRFPDLVEEATLRRAWCAVLVAKREAAGLSQTEVAARMGTAASVVSKLEDGGDAKVSMMQRYCRAIGEGFPCASKKMRRQARRPM